jgi:carbon storage regulator
MLVLSRKLNEEILINGNVTVKVIAISGTQVRLGVEAPDDVSIKRPDAAKRPAAKKPVTR